MGKNSQISLVLLGKIYCDLSMNMGKYMPKNHELILPGIPNVLNLPKPMLEGTLIFNGKN